MSPVTIIPAQPDDDPPELPPSLTVAEYKALIDKQLNGDDPLLELQLRAAFAIAQSRTKRNLVPPSTETTETIETAGGRRRVVVPDASEITLVTADGTDVSESVTTISRNGYIVQVAVPDPVDAIAVTGTFGFLDIPHDLKLAIYVLAARMDQERNAGFADAVTIGDGAATQRFRDMPQSVKAVFGTYALPRALWGLA